MLETEQVTIGSDSQQSASVVVVCVDVEYFCCVAVTGVIVHFVVVAFVDDLQLIINPTHDPYLSLSLSYLTKCLFFNVAVEFDIFQNIILPPVFLFFMFGCRIYKAGQNRRTDLKLTLQLN